MLFGNGVQRLFSLPMVSVASARWFFWGSHDLVGGVLVTNASESTGTPAPTVRRPWSEPQRAARHFFMHGHPPSVWPDRVAGQEALAVRAWLEDDDSSVGQVAVQALLSCTRTRLVGQAGCLRDGRPEVGHQHVDALQVVRGGALTTPNRVRCRLDRQDTRLTTGTKIGTRLVIGRPTGNTHPQQLSQASGAYLCSGPSLCDGAWLAPGLPRSP